MRTSPLPEHNVARAFHALAILALLSFSGSLPRAQNKPSSADFASLSKQAEAARQADHVDEAVLLYRKALALQPKWVEGWWALGTLEYDRSNYSAAAASLRRLVLLAPKDGSARGMLGLCEFELGQDAAALRDIQEGRRLGMSNNQQLHQIALYHEGLLLLRAARFKSAQGTFGMLCKEGVQSGQLMDGMGMAVLRTAPHAAPPPDSPGAAILRRVGVGACLATQRKFDDAFATYNALLAEYPDYPNLHYAVGLCYVEANNVPEAIDQFKIELQRDHSNYAASLEIATTLYKVDSTTALEYAQAVIQQKPELPFPHYLVGLLYLDLGDHAKAIPELELAAKSLKQDPRVYFALSTAYSRAGRKQDAAQARATYEKLKRSTETSAATY